MIYRVAERFKSVQGEGVWAGTPMAFIRFVGCSVGKKICNACDTSFEKTHPWHGGGEYSAQDLLDWAAPLWHVVLTGGEPLNWDLVPIFEEARARQTVEMLHVETSGTVQLPERLFSLWVTCSPKPGFIEEEVLKADEVKVIVPGLGDGPGWPTLEDALRWADGSRPVFLQPRNLRSEINRENLRLCEQLVLQHPQLRLSVQLHKLLAVR